MVKRICCLGILFLLTGCGSAVTVNNVQISNNEVNSMVKAQKQIMGKVSNDQEKAIRLNIINNLIDQSLLIQEAEKQSLQVTEGEVETKYDDTLDNWKNGGELQQSLKAQGFTKSNMKKMIKDQLLIQSLSDSLIPKTDEPNTNIAKTQELITQLRAQATIKTN